MSRVASCLLQAARRHLLDRRVAELPTFSGRLASLLGQAEARDQQHSVWRPTARGFAGGTSGGDAKPPPGEQPGPQPAPQQPAEEAQAGAPPSAARGGEDGKEAPLASSGGGDSRSSGSEAASGSSQAPGGAASGSSEGPTAINPELQQYIQQLKQLKGSSTVLRQDVGGPAWWQTLLQATLGRALEGWITDFVRARVETDFDRDEFVEGAMDAYWMVHKLLEQEDWEALRPMMSAKLLGAFRDTVAAYRADGLVWRTAISPALEAHVRGMGFATKPQMEKYDPDKAALAPSDISVTAAPSGTFLVLTVHIQGEQTVTITRHEDGQVVAELKDRRLAKWRFATGPLPSGLPVSRLDTDWFLLSI